MVLNIKNVFLAISQKQELIEKNNGHFWLQRAEITLKKLYTQQQTEFFFVGQCNYSRLDKPFSVPI